MLPITLRSPPKVEDFMSLADYQSQTPASFHDGKPVLHYHAAGIKGWLATESVGKLPIFPVAEKEKGPTEPESVALGGNTRDKTEQILDVFVTSETFTLFNQSAQVGVSIPYPLIAIHATSSATHEDYSIKTIWLQIQLSDSGNDDEYDDAELTLIPSQTTSADSPQFEAQKLYLAISACSDLHPDPAIEGEDDNDAYPNIIVEGSAEHEALEGFQGVLRGSDNGGLPPPMPGSSGWITAENVHEFFDAEGNWIGGKEEAGVSGELGEGAGRRRGREEVEAKAGAKGQEDKEDPESKRARVD